MSTRQINLAAAVAKVQAAAGPLDQRSSVYPELRGTSTGVPGWSHFMPIDREQTEAWRGRQRHETVRDMLNDSQVAALWQAVRLPLHRYTIALDPRDASAVAVDLIATDLDLPLVDHEDEPRPSVRPNDFDQRRHLGRAVEALVQGHAVFEQPGYIDAAGYWRLTDLPPVPPWTLDDQSWIIDDHGKLLRVEQNGGREVIALPADHLVVFTWQGDPGDYRGRSILRPLYGSWLMRDRTLRVMGMSAERTGMGIPVGRVGQGAPPSVKQAMERLLSGLAAGEDTNLVLETDDDITKSIMLMGVTGSTPDLVSMLRYLDDAMARALLATVMQTGTTPNGSQAGSDNLMTLLSMFHDVAVDWYCRVMTEQLVKRWVARNPVGDESPAVVWKRREEAPDAPVVDEPATDPAATDESPVPAPVTARRRSAPQATLARRQRAVRTAFAAVAGRELRRDPTPVELAAATDFGQLEREHVAAVDDLAAVLLRDRDELAATAVAIVAAMPTVDPLTLGGALGPLLAAHANAMDTAPLVTMLTATAAQGVAQVVGEAARQGVTISPDVDYAARATVEANELQRRMAVQVTEACATAARTVAPAPVLSRGRLGRIGARFAPRGLGPAGRSALDGIEAHLALLTPAAAEQAAAGATSRANGAGRFAAMSAAPIQTVVASELLDANCCGPCAAVDGTEYASVEEAMGDYPGLGSYVACEGMERCRGTAVAIFEGEV